MQNNVVLKVGEDSWSWIKITNSYWSVEAEMIKDPDFGEY